MDNPTPAAIKQFMEGLGAERTSMDEWRLDFPFTYETGRQRPYVFFDDQQAAFWYGVVQQARADERKRTVLRLSAWAIDTDLIRGSSERVSFRVDDWNAIREQLTTPAKQPEQEKE